MGSSKKPNLNVVKTNVEKTEKINIEIIDTGDNPFSVIKHEKNYFTTIGNQRIEVFSKKEEALKAISKPNWMYIACLVDAIVQFRENISNKNLKK